MTRLLTLDELADLLRSTPAAVYALRYRGEGPPAIRVGRRLLFDEGDVTLWLETRRETALDAAH